MATGERFLKALDKIRGIPGRIKLRDEGLRLYTVAIRVKTWDGSRPGVDNSSSTDADSTFWVDAGTHRPRVVQVTQRDIIMSGGAYQDQDLKVGPITPPYRGGAADNSAIGIFDPSPTGQAVEIFFNVQGPGMATGGTWFEKFTMQNTRPFRYEFVIRRTGRVPT